MFLVNKLVGWALSPMGVGLMFFVLGLALVKAGATRVWARRLGMTLLLVMLAWMWAWSTPAVQRLMGFSLEREFWTPEASGGGVPVPRVETMPECDAIVILGGGMGGNQEASPYAEMWSGADRVWHAARAWKAGKAKVVVPTGKGCAESDAQLLLDLGVPRESIHVENAARNTEENAKFAEQTVNSCVPAKVPAAPRKVLLVTSAWHMKRSLLMFKTYAPSLDVVPCATDFETTVRFAKRGLAVADFFPDATSLWQNTVLFHEWVGYWGYKFFR
jgi:uncharacterized SAM-binding protein YcdF (DUF218 family)